MDLNVNLNLTIKPSDQAPAWATQILQMIGVIIAKEDKIMSAQTDALDQAEAAAAANSAADDSAEALLVQLVQLYNEAAANSNDPAVTERITALGKAITDRSSRLAAAVAANTPAAPSA